MYFEEKKGYFKIINYGHSFSIVLLKVRTTMSKIGLKSKTMIACDMISILQFFHSFSFGNQNEINVILVVSLNKNFIYV